jgi:NhaP-type Na+/H+ or K+/H+ antiporter
MQESLVQFAWLAFFSMFALWLGWRFKVPAIVFLIIAGFASGPVFNLIQPDVLFGDLLDTLIPVAVGIILFEGSLTLDFREVQKARRAIWNIVLVGAPVAWGLTTAAAHFIGGLSIPVSVTFGALLVVTGPTVILPLLRHARLQDKTGSVLKWEGIINDPIGAILAVLSYEFFTKYYLTDASIIDFLLHATISISIISVASVIFGYMIRNVLNNGHVPEYLKAPFLLSFVVIFFVLCNELLHESGLIGVTILGIALANLGIHSIEEIRKFKESISLILISTLFVILTARIDPAILLQIRMEEILFLVAVLVIVRPLTAFFSSIRTGLGRNEVIYIGWIAPRGIVCAAIAGIMGPRLVDAGFADGADLLPLAFALVLITVFLHGLSAKPLARKLGLAHEEQNSLIMVGASDWGLQLADTLAKRGVNVLIADNDWYRLRKARLSDISTYYGEILSEESEYNVELSKYTGLVALTGNAPYNTLVCAKFAYEFGRENTYQLDSQKPEDLERNKITETLAGSDFADNNLSYWRYADLFRDGWRFKATRMGDEANAKALRQQLEDEDILFIGIIRATDNHVLFSKKYLKTVKQDDILIYFKNPSAVSA